MPDTPALTDDQIETAYAQLQQRKAAEAEAARQAQLAPIKDLLDGAAFPEVLAKVTELRASVGVDSPFFQHLNAAVVGLAGLKTAAV